jgi:hypothetical protein
VYWHADPARKFWWFVQGDFVRLNAWAGGWAGGVYAVLLAVFALRQLVRWRSRLPVNPGKVGVVLSTAAAWYVGIVATNSDFAFTATTVVAHGVPYLALVWLYGRRKWAGDEGWRGTFHRPAGVLLFVGALLALAYVEEGVWDVLVWKEHSAVFFGAATAWEPGPALLSLLVPLLALPQATHYLLDAWIWRFDGSNPDLRSHLLGYGPP